MSKAVLRCSDFALRHSHMVLSRSSVPSDFGVAQYSLGKDGSEVLRCGRCADMHADVQVGIFNHPCCGPLGDDVGKPMVSKAVIEQGMDAGGVALSHKTLDFGFELGLFTSSGSG